MGDGFWGRARGATRGRTEGSDGDETVRLSRAPDAQSTARPMAVPALTLPPRPALARSGANAERLVPERAHALGHGPAGVHAPTPGGLRRGSRGAPLSLQARESGRAG